MVQEPRIYRIFRKIGKVKSFQDILNNFFEPLFAATLEPERHPAIRSRQKCPGTTTATVRWWPNEMGKKAGPEGPVVIDF